MKVKFALIIALILIAFGIFVAFAIYESEEKVNFDAESISASCKEDENKSYRISEKCVALLAYGLLSEDENDIPLGGACQGLVSDTLLKILNDQKILFYRWKRYGIIDSSKLLLNLEYKDKGYLGLLPDLINNRIRIEWTHGMEKDWHINAGIIKDKFGGDYSFIWKHFIFGLTASELLSLKLDSLARINSYNDYESYLNSEISLDSIDGINIYNNFMAELDSTERTYYESHEPWGYSVSKWCMMSSDLIIELEKFSPEDFIVKYYKKNCLLVAPSERPQGEIKQKPLG